ncbi:serine protease 1-like isoform X1 [Physella acuta]|uniref:serine protease 1-like isoform X1 n=1 Tax=Physella acuta TaxID=109671 RepID=UPI0027DE1263|nr:serine protease 1-like isoform X1 [Physella acuta]XP_059161624.1 serine protease 1-like isoform X2 [Physella acuta]XP_059161625.1 serine protease 1-like isoform X1 [Physella acuta]
MVKTSTALFTAVFVVVGAVINVHASNRNERAIGGQEFKRGQWPWLVLLKGEIVTSRLFGLLPLGKRYATCGGVLISDQWLVSAGHCFEDSNWRWKASLGSVRYKPSFGDRFFNLVGKVIDSDRLRVWEVKVERIIIHPHINRTEFSNDIALVKLSKAVPASGRYSNIRSIPLPSEEDSSFPQPGQVCVTKGWGCTTKDQGPSSHARQIEIPVLEPAVCNLTYRKSMDNRICAGHINMGVGVCQGDSGSPLACKKGNNYALAGIVSFNSKHHPENYPAVFTKIHSYIPWIKSVMTTFN